MPYADLQRPTYGPANPYRTVTTALTAAQKNTLTGHAEAHAISDLDFETQRRSFQAFGYGLDPASIGQAEAKLAGKTEKAAAFGVPDALSFMPERNKAQVAKLKEKRKREERGDAADLDKFKGPWAGYQGEGVDDLPDAPAEEEEEEDEEEEDEATRAYKEAKRQKRALGLTGDEKTILHSTPSPSQASKGAVLTKNTGKSAVDYLGRTYMHVPQDQGIRLDRHPGDHECYLPKRIIHTWKGHTAGVNAIRFFPTSGHLLLSASNDHAIKVSLFLLFRADQAH